jgi:YidC/Oxa1 family membrane protein insertase
MSIWNTFILTPLVNVLIWIYNFLFHNFGLAIILFTIIIKLITYPLTAQQLKSQMKMQELNSSKKYIEMQKKYKDDKQRLSQEQMALYKEMGINPLGGCLPLLIQFPIMIGLYQSIMLAMAAAPIQLLNLYRSIYQFIPASVLIPINSQFLGMNLALPESSAPLLSIPLPSGAMVAIPIMTGLVVLTTYLQSKLMSPSSANPADQGAQMSKSMNLMMPVMMGFITWSLASGLALYFIVSNLLGIAQYAFMGKANWRNLLPVKAKAVGIKK